MAKKQKSGMYRARVKIGVGPDGNDIYKYVSGRTKRELETNRQDIIKYYIEGVTLADDRVFGEYAQEWYRLRLVPNASVSTAQSYRDALNVHILPIFGDRKLRAIRPLELQTFLDSFAGTSASHITYVYAALRKIYRAAVADRIVEHDPTASIVKPAATPAREKPVLSPRDRAVIAQVCASHPRALYLALMFYLGLRPGEALGAQWGDVNWIEHTIFIQRDIDFKNHGKAGSLKTDKSRRVIPIPDPLYELLLKNRGFPTTYMVTGELSGTALSKSSCERLWVELMKECGLVQPIPEKTAYHVSDPRRYYKPIITAHTLRHNFVTMCWEEDIDVYTTAKLVGHSNITTTLAIYTHLTERRKQQAASKLNSIFNNMPKIDEIKPAPEKISSLSR